VRRHAKRYHVDVTPLQRVWGTLCGRTVFSADRIGFHSREIPGGHRVTCRACLRLRKRAKRRAP
jgi:hypothetical protein